MAKTNKTTVKFQKWLVLSGSHHQNGIKYGKGQKFVSNSDINRFNTLPHAPKYKLVGEATEAEILQFQAESGFVGEDGEPVHVPMEEGQGPGFLNKPAGKDTTKATGEVDAELQKQKDAGGFPTKEDADEDAPEDSLEAMTVAELRAAAEDEEIDLSGLHLKADIVAKIREARAE